jgi:hypothetical protein
MRTFKEFGEYVLKHSRHGENPSNRVHIIVNYPKIKWDDWAEYMATLTWFSGIPLGRGGSKNAHVIFAESIDQALKNVEQYEYAMISYIGSFYYSDHDDNIHTHFDEFCKSDHACRGHLLFHPSKPYGRLHPQTIFVNLNHWREIGKPSFGLHTGKVINYERSVSNVHDDYTPHWVKAGEGYKNVVMCEQGEYISKVLESGKKILNFDKQRKVKFFCYPERRQSDTLDAERNRPSNIVYTRNNESIGSIKGKKFDVIYAPASGNLAEKLYAMYANPGCKLVIYDYNLDSIRWKKTLYMMQDIEGTNSFFKRNSDCIIDDCSYKPELLAKSKGEFSDEEWLNVIKSVNPEVIQYDILDGPFDVDPSKKNLVYLSNIFSYNFVIHKMKIEEIHNVFKQYLQLPNTTVVGKNVFKDSVYHENSMR